MQATNCIHMPRLPPGLHCAGAQPPRYQRALDVVVALAVIPQDAHPATAD